MKKTVFLNFEPNSALTFMTLKSTKGGNLSFPNIQDTEKNILQSINTLHIILKQIPNTSFHVQMF